MNRAGVGRDLGLTLHMLVTATLLAALYLLLGVALWRLTELYDPVLVIAIGAFALVAYFATSAMALHLTAARVVGPDEAPELHRVVDRLCALANLRKPKIAIVESTIPNAFAVAWSERSATVAVTSALRKRLDERELEAVVAHELSHIANRDVLVMTPASFFPIAASFLWEWLTILWPIAALLFVTGGSLSLALSRYREYAADRGAALLTGRPEALMSALQKIASDVALIPKRDLRATAGVSALFIVPTSTARWRIWADHPSLDERLSRLSEISRALGKGVD